MRCMLTSRIVFFSAIHTGKRSRIRHRLAPPPLPTLLQPPPPPEVATVVAIFQGATQVLMNHDAAAHPPPVHSSRCVPCTFLEPRCCSNVFFAQGGLWNAPTVKWPFASFGGNQRRVSQSPPTNHPPPSIFQLNSTRCSTAPPLHYSVSS